MSPDTRENLTKIIKKLLLLAGVLVALELVYRVTFYPKDLREHCSLMALSQIPVKGDAQIIYLGESSNKTYRNGEPDTSYISEMIAEQMPEYRFGHITKDAAHVAIYYDILRNIPHDNDIHTVILTVNMRSFSSEWIYSNLENSFHKQQVFMQKGPALWRRLQLDLKMNESWTEEERQELVIEGFKKQKFDCGPDFPFYDAYYWDHYLSHGLWLPHGRELSRDSILMASHYVKIFAYTLDSNNVRIKDLDKIVNLCKERNWRLVFNILPDNVDQIKEMVGDELLALMHKQNAYIVKRYTAKGVLVVNNENLARDEDFIDRDFPTEHYGAQARHAIADHIVQQMRQEWGY